MDEYIEPIIVIILMLGLFGAGGLLSERVKKVSNCMADKQTHQNWVEQILAVVGNIIFEIGLIIMTFVLAYGVWGLSCMAEHALFDLCNGGKQVGVDLMFLSSYSVFAWYIFDDLYRPSLWEVRNG